MTWYLSGPMSGIKEHNFPAFIHAKLTLEMLGYTITSPHECVVDEAKQWSDYLREDIKKLVDADGIILLRGFRKSRGAQLELEIAMRLGMPVRFFNEVTGELQDLE